MEYGICADGCFREINGYLLCHLNFIANLVNTIHPLTKKTAECQLCGFGIPVKVMKLGQSDIKKNRNDLYYKLLWQNHQS